MREELCLKRQLVSKSDRKIAAESALKHLLQSQLFQKSQNIGCYLALDHELDCLPIILEIWKAHKNCFVPRMLAKQQLEFVKIYEKSALALNKFNILEPQEASPFPIQQLDLVIVPLVAFDKNGNRIGMGGGYYDRAFSFLKENFAKPKMLGLAYQFQEIAEFTPDPWDISLDGVLTETQLMLIK